MIGSAPSPWGPSRELCAGARVGCVAAAIASLALVACGSQCDRHPDEAPVVYKDGVTDQGAHVYMSSPNAKDPWRGPWLDFPPGRTYRFPHHLGGTPRDVEYWFSFNPDPIPPGAGNTSGFVFGSGNQGTVQAANPDYVDIRNDTCSDVFLMVRIADPAPSGDGGPASDAGTD